MLGGIIAGALGGAAKAVGDIAEGQIQDKRKADLAQMMADMELEKQKSLETFRSDMKLQNIPKEAAATADAADVTDKRNIERDAANGKRRAEVNAGNVAAGIQAENDAGLPELKAGQEKRIFDAGKSKRDAEFNEKIANASNPKYLKSLSAEARAKHVDSIAEVARANAVNYELGKQKSVDALSDELLDPAVKPERAAAITRKLTAMGVLKGNSEFDTEKVTTETAPDGTVISTKTESTQKRKPGVPAKAAAAAKPAAGPWDKYNPATPVAND